MYPLWEQRYGNIAAIQNNATVFVVSSPRRITDTNMKARELYKNPGSYRHHVG